MNKRCSTILAVLVLLCCVNLHAENIDPHESDMQYAWGENVGWLNFEPNAAGPDIGASIGEFEVTGFIWAENIGWINLDPNEADPNTGVSNDGAGNLSGYAWGENIGWINFNPAAAGDANDYGVKIDTDGAFYGWAWGENIGWINFGIADNYVVACKVTFEDLGNFVDDWLDGGGAASNLDGDRDVDFADYNILASYWLDYCPDSWPLK